MPAAIVTGASQGIGRAISLRLADDGFDVAVNDIAARHSELQSLKAEIESKGRSSVAVVGDVSIEEDVNQLVEVTVEALGHLAVMVANAGIILTKRVMDLTIDEWDRVQAVNVKGVLLCYRAAGRQMIAQGNGGKIIGACSISGYRPQPTAIAYSVSKWAVRGLTQATAIEFAPHGINMWDQIDDNFSNVHGVPKGHAFEQAVQSRSAMKKPQTPEDIAGCVSFLASKDSGMITGQSIIIDGGIQFS
ncbi:hypothetical protein PENCOP_c002G05176 [Penicillium coprophilum]|uniref:Diacetyl reductase [(S)-acetoin forming] n=1 Tax=Penicillium coprophilum TaxID=36646 RepID=A0A1V6V387_9EURO|nr:hypothetical protein PENCOP_c002G05176 [Penicillium coprophilum]